MLQCSGAEVSLTLPPCRGIPDTVSCPVQWGCHHISCHHSSVGGALGKGISFHYQWEEKLSDPLSSGTHLFSKNSNPQRGLYLTPPPSGTGTQLSPALAPTAKSVFHPSLPWMPSHCSHHKPSQTLPCCFFTLGLEKRSCCSSSRCEFSHAKSWLHSQGYHTRPQGTLWISNCTHVLHLLTHAHFVMSGAQDQW